MAKVEDKDLFWCYNPESNSIAITVQHLWGNMLNRWTDFLTSEKEWHNRDEEFEDIIKTRKSLMQKCLKAQQVSFN